MFELQFQTHIYTNTRDGDTFDVLNIAIGNDDPSTSPRFPITLVYHRDGQDKKWEFQWKISNEVSMNIYQLVQFIFEEGTDLMTVLGRLTTKATEVVYDNMMGKYMSIYDATQLHTIEEGKGYTVRAGVHPGLLIPIIDRLGFMQQ